MPLVTNSFVYNCSYKKNTIFVSKPKSIIMKKIFSIALLGALLLFVSCEESTENAAVENAAVGNWNVSKIIVTLGTSNLEVTPDNFNQYLVLIPEDNRAELENVMNGSITFNEDYSYSTSIYGEVIVGTYTLDGTEGTLSSSTEEELNFTIDTEKDPYEISSSMQQEEIDFTVYLTKQ